MDSCADVAIDQNCLCYGKMDNRKRLQKYHMILSGTVILPVMKGRTSTSEDYTGEISKCKVFECSNI